MMMVVWPSTSQTASCLRVASSRPDATTGAPSLPGSTT